MQGLDRFVFCKFRVTDLGLQVAHDTLGFRQRPFGFVACRGFGGKRGFRSLQPAAGGGDRRGDSAMGRRRRGILYLSFNEYEITFSLDDLVII